MICECCGKEFFEDWRKDKRKPLRFCSFSCGRTRKHSKAAKEKISKALTKKESKFCSICGGKLGWRNKKGVCMLCKKEHKLSNNENVKLCRKNRKILLVVEKGGKCERCGYDKYIEALEFHHLNPKEKKFNISHKSTRSLEKEREEIKKCILVCSTCHKELHIELKLALEKELKISDNSIKGG